MGRVFGLLVAPPACQQPKDAGSAGFAAAAIPSVVTHMVWCHRCGL